MLTRERKIEILDIVITGFQKQQAFSINKDTDLCMYRDLVGNKCAIGMLIPDELYDECLERISMRQACVEDYRGHTQEKIKNLFDYLKVDKNNLKEIEFYSDLQRIHDENASSDRKDFEQMLMEYKEMKQEILGEM